MRWWRWMVMALLVGCGHGQRAGSGGGNSGGAGRPRMDLHCTPQNRFDEGECAASGKDCRFGPPLQCYGTQPPPEVLEAQRQAYEAGTQPCVCSCEEDRVRCMSVP